MKKYFLLQARQTGKTTKAIYEYLKDDKNTLFVSFDEQSTKRVCKKAKGNPKHFISAKSFKTYATRGGANVIPFKNIILDEYLFFENKSEIYKLVQYLSPENIYIFSSPNKRYEKESFDLVKNNKHNKSANEILELYIEKQGGVCKKVQNEIYELYYNFITDFDTVLIDSDLGISNSRKKELRHIMGEESYETEILNQYLR